jgi:hypothetical protein
MRNCSFPIRKAGIFCPGKEIKGLRGGVHGYVAQTTPRIDAARAKKHPFRTETNYFYAASVSPISPKASTSSKVKILSVSRIMTNSSPILPMPLMNSIFSFIPMRGGGSI